MKELALNEGIYLLEWRIRLNTRKTGQGCPVFFLNYSSGKTCYAYLPISIMNCFEIEFW